MLYGEPRMTNDMDVVVELPVMVAKRLLDVFPEKDYYCPPFEVIQDEILNGGQFNIIHVESGSKVDFVLRKDTDFARTEFQRRVMMPFSETLEAYTATPEDVILSKLMYYQMGESEKHLRDIKGVLEISGDVIDQDYISHWVSALGLQEPWKECQ